MEDLLGEDWQSTKPSASFTSIHPAKNSLSHLNHLQPSILPPSSVTPVRVQHLAGSQNDSKKATPTGNDQFGSLLSFKSKPAEKNVSMQERQRQSLAEKERRQQEDSRLWDILSNGRVPSTRRQSTKKDSITGDTSDDLLAAFHRSAPVNKDTHYPPPQQDAVDTGTDILPVTFSALPMQLNDDDDDPFGLADFSKSIKASSQIGHPGHANSGDDVLGELSKPLPPAMHSKTRAIDVVVPQDSLSSSSADHTAAEKDHMIAELAEMGFSPDNAEIALTETRGDVQDAVGWLLRQAHAESKRATITEPHKQPLPDGRSDSRSKTANGRRGSSDAARIQSSTGVLGNERDAGQMAQEFGTKLFKSANSLWKASQKQMAKTISEFQQDRDSAQPRWLQESKPDAIRPRASRASGSTDRSSSAIAPSFTDEANLLDAPRDVRSSKTPSRHRGQDVDQKSTSTLHSTRDVRLPAVRSVENPSLARLNRQHAEAQAADSYVSPARRRPPKSRPDSESQQQVDLFSSASVPCAANTPMAIGTRQGAGRASAPAPTPSIPRPSRPIPEINSTILAASLQHRQIGAEHFKRGDYAAAHSSYTAAMSGLPETHPIAIIVLCNRSLTAIKTGDPKLAVHDADKALAIIGSGHGIGEVISAGPGESNKEMREFYGKALMRKAEALENMEKWSDAAGAWRRAVEAGFGGAISARGRDRCEKAASPQAVKEAPTTPQKVISAKPKAQAQRTIRPKLPETNAAAEAVQKLRDANAAAEKADDERFALSDQVDARLTAWKGGKADNLRALLQSLGDVLWEEAGWRKVGMGDLVMPNKVKIVYMKAIAKVHPDKIPTNATTEQRMISSAVFSTLNEAWDKFKAENNL